MKNEEKGNLDASLLWFVFLKPLDKLSEALCFPFYYDSNNPNCIEQNLRFFRRHRLDIPEGNVAVFIYDLDTESYYYYKTIKHRRKSFALPNQ